MKLGLTLVALVMKASNNDSAVDVSVLSFIICFRELISFSASIIIIMLLISSQINAKRGHLFKKFLQLWSNLITLAPVHRIQELFTELQKCKVKKKLKQRTAE